MNFIEIDRNRLHLSKNLFNKKIYKIIIYKIYKIYKIYIKIYIF